MFSAQFGREAEHDPLQVRYGGLVSNVFQRHMLDLELLLDRALGAAAGDAEQERMAFAIAEVLFKAAALPPVGLVHRVLGLLWGSAEGSAFVRNTVQLFNNVVWCTQTAPHRAGRRLSFKLADTGIRNGAGQAQHGADAQRDARAQRAPPRGQGRGRVVSQQGPLQHQPPAPCNGRACLLHLR